MVACPFARSLASTCLSCASATVARARSISRESIAAPYPFARVRSSSAELAPRASRTRPRAARSLAKVARSSACHRVPRGPPMRITASSSASACAGRPAVSASRASARRSCTSRGLLRTWTSRSCRAITAPFACTIAGTSSGRGALTHPVATAASRRAPRRLATSHLRPARPACPATGTVSTCATCDPETLDFSSPCGPAMGTVSTCATCDPETLDFSSP